MANKIELPMEIRNYLLGDFNQSLLLIGENKERLLSDALYIGAQILHTDKLNTHPDYMYVGLPDKRATIGVENVLPIIDRASLMPSNSDRHVCIIDGMEKLTLEAQNKLLKLLEESSSMVVIGICLESDKILKTVRSRMQTIYYKAENFIKYTNEIGSAEDYFISKGNLLFDDVSELQCIFEEVKKSLSERDALLLLESLHLVKEKDNDNFFLKYKEYVPNLISYIGYVSTELFCKNPHTTAYTDIIDVVSAHRKCCTYITYTKDVFFSMIVQIISKMEE